MPYTSYSLSGLRRRECIGFPPQAKSKKEVIVIKSENPSRKGGDLSVMELVIAKVYCEQYFFECLKGKGRDR